MTYPRRKILKVCGYTSQWKRRDGYFIFLYRIKCTEEKDINSKADSSSVA